MTNEQIDLLLNRILSGNLIFFYDDQEYQLRCPTPQLKYQSCILYNDILSDEKYNTWIKEENMNRMMILLGIWDKDSHKMISTLEKKIEDLKLMFDFQIDEILPVPPEALIAWNYMANKGIEFKLNYQTMIDGGISFFLQECLDENVEVNWLKKEVNLVDWYKDKTVYDW